MNVNRLLRLKLLIHGELLSWSTIVWKVNLFGSITLLESDIDWSPKVEIKQGGDFASDIRPRALGIELLDWLMVSGGDIKKWGSFLLTFYNLKEGLINLGFGIEFSRGSSNIRDLFWFCDRLLLSEQLYSKYSFNDGSWKFRIGEIIWNPCSTYSLSVTYLVSSECRLVHALGSTGSTPTFYLLSSL